MKKMTVKQRKIDEYIISGSYGVVYRLYNTVNGKSYIGVTTRSLEQRFKEHCKADSYVGNAIRKHGIENFTKAVIDYADTHDELMELEIEYIKRYDTFKSGYNRTLGGEGFNLIPNIELNLTVSQKRFIAWVKRENQRFIDINDGNSMVRSIMINLLSLYLTAIKPSDKIKTSKLILKMQPNNLKELLRLEIVALEELIHYSRQKLQSFEVI